MYQSNLKLMAKYRSSGYFGPVMLMLPMIILGSISFSLPVKFDLQLPRKHVAGQNAK